MSINIPHQQRVSRTFSNAAEQYEQAAVLQKEIANRLLERSQALALKKPKKILDIGCGSGYLTRLLQKQYRHSEIIGLDLATGMLQYAKTQERSWLNKVNYHCADSRQLPLADKSIDLVISNLMLQWCPDFSQVLAELVRVLKPDGYLLLTTFGPATLYELRESWASVDQFEHVNNFIDMQELGDGCAAVGLRDSVLDIDKMTLTHADIYGVMNHLKKIGANHVRGSRAQGLYGRNKFKQLAKAYEQYRHEGLLPATYEVIYVYAKGASLAKLGAQIQNPTEVKIPISALQKPDFN